MTVYLEMLALAAVVVFIVDLSGFTDTVLDFASRVSGRRVISMKPFTCSLCSTFWACCIWALCRSSFGIATLAWSAALAYITPVIGGALALIRAALQAVIDKFIEKI